LEAAAGEKYGDPAPKSPVSEQAQQEDHIAEVMWEPATEPAPEAASGEDLAQVLPLAIKRSSSSDPPTPFVIRWQAMNNNKGELGRLLAEFAAAEDKAVMSF